MFQFFAESLQPFDVVVLATGHKAFDYDFVNSISSLEIDTRGPFAPGSNTLRA